MDNYGYIYRTTKEKIRLANLGKKYSEETKEKHRKCFFARERNAKGQLV